MKIVPSSVGAPHNFSLLQDYVLTVTSGFEVVQTAMKVAWKSATIMHGALCVMTPGVLLMQELHADSLGLYPQVLAD